MFLIFSLKKSIQVAPYLGLWFKTKPNGLSKFQKIFIRIIRLNYRSPNQLDENEAVIILVNGGGASTINYMVCLLLGTKIYLQLCTESSCLFDKLPDSSLPNRMATV